MNEWFEEFTGILNGADYKSNNLIGAGKASAELAMDHYRYQHISKIQSVVEETFSRLKEVLGEEWVNIWRDFWKSFPRSPRSLDFYPDVFLEYYLGTGASLQLMELARFERLLDVYAWTHRPLIASTIQTLGEETKVKLGEYVIENFKTPVVALYNGTECGSLLNTMVLFLSLIHI